MTEVIGRQAHTIHRRLWSLNKDVKDGSVELEDAQLRGVVIVDEVSMVDIKTLAWLLSFVHPSAVLVFVGDADQLPSVGPGSVLRDLLNTPSMAATRLTQIFRQAAASDIVRHAHAINQGMTPPIERLSGEIVRARGWPKTDFFLIEEEDQTKMADKAVWAATHMAPRLGFDPLADVQVLTPMKRGDAGVGNLNRVLQGAPNPSPGDSIKRFDLATWGVGDRLMQLKNNYDYDIYNGDQGRIVRFTRKQDDSDPTHLVLDVNGREVEIEREDFHQLTLAYAATVHKSQGSEFPFVVICLHTSHFTLLQRNLPLHRGHPRQEMRGSHCAPAGPFHGGRQQQSLAPQHVFDSATHSLPKGRVMAQTKYQIFKNEDAVKYLTDEQKAQLTNIIATIAVGRRQDGKTLGDLMFVLNMKDIFAIRAMDAYIAAVHDDGRYVGNQAIAEVLDVATDIRQVAALKITPRLPD